MMGSIQFVGKTVRGRKRTGTAGQEWQGQRVSREEQRDRRLAALSRWARQHTRSGARGRGARAASAGTAAAARRRDPLRTTTPGTTVYTRR